MALPALTINYLGQGALVLADPKAIENPFFLLYPDWALLPMIALATAATVIASQAVITGAYSITQQAIQLGLLPRLEIRHTSESLIGQIYMPKVNTLLLIGVLLLVVTVSIVKRAGIRLRHRRHGYHGGNFADGLRGDLEGLALVGSCGDRVLAPLLGLDLTFLAANLLKVFEGGWMPLALGGVVMS